MAYLLAFALALVLGVDPPAAALGLAFAFP